MTLNFDYNEDGLRTKKTVIETDAAGIEHTTTTDYILHAANILLILTVLLVSIGSASASDVAVPAAGWGLACIADESLQYELVAYA